jgi:hypothetical protein
MYRAHDFHVLHALVSRLSAIPPQRSGRVRRLAGSWPRLAARPGHYARWRHAGWHPPALSFVDPPSERRRTMKASRRCRVEVNPYMSGAAISTAQRDIQRARFGAAHGVFSTDAGLAPGLRRSARPTICRRYFCKWSRFAARAFSSINPWPFAASSPRQKTRPDSCDRRDAGAALTRRPAKALPRRDPNAQGSSSSRASLSRAIAWPRGAGCETGEAETPTGSCRPCAPSLAHGRCLSSLAGRRRPCRGGSRSLRPFRAYRCSVRR